jgi:hypothetical protein
MEHKESKMFVVKKWSRDLPDTWGIVVSRHEFRILAERWVKRQPIAARSDVWFSVEQE